MFVIERCVSVDHPGWLLFRELLWPHCSREQQLIEMQQGLEDPTRFNQFVACDASKSPIGFAEASIRKDYVNGTETFPVVFLEGIYVSADHRQKGVARALVDAVAEWGRECGCREFASDAPLENHQSQAFHKATGFEETERVVCFRKWLGDAGSSS